jgi:hypothetical protein
MGENQGGTIRYLVLATSMLLLMAPARSETGMMSINEVALKAREAFGQAKDASVIESIKSWCKAGIRGASAPSPPYGLKDHLQGAYQPTPQRTQAA